MNKILQIIAITLCNSFVFNGLRAQVNLPYFTGFDNATQKNGWVTYKKAATTFSEWGFNTVDYFSPSNCISHDYSPSSGITLTDNWYVSPSFNIGASGKLDSLRFRFSGFSTPAEGDTIAVYLLHGSPDPAVAKKYLLHDFRGTNYLLNGMYNLLDPIVFPAVDASKKSYLAIRYCNSDCSTKWLTVYFDNIAISGGNANGIKNTSTSATLQCLPNPAKNSVEISTQTSMSKIQLFALDGKMVKEENNILDSKINLDLTAIQNGVYIVKIFTQTEIYTQKLRVQK